MSIENQNIVWEISNEHCNDHKKRGVVDGTVVLDVDGTLTDPENPSLIYSETIETLTLFLEKGGNIVLSTGASLERIEQTLLEPIASLTTPSSNLGYIVILPEYGSAVCLKENPLRSLLIKKRELHVPDKSNLRAVLQERILPYYPDVYIAGDSLEDRIKRNYTIGLKRLDNPLRLKRFIEEELMSIYPEIDWRNIQLMAESHSLDFVHRQTGKDLSLIWAINEISSLRGMFIGFGDSGDQFARVVPTFNVNPQANEFQAKGLPYLEPPANLKGAGHTTVQLIKQLMKLGYFNSKLD